MAIVWQVLYGHCMADDVKRAPLRAVGASSAVAKITFWHTARLRTLLDELMELRGDDQTAVLNDALVLWAEALRRQRDGAMLTVADLETGEAWRLKMEEREGRENGEAEEAPLTPAGKITFNLKVRGHRALTEAQQLEGLNQADTLHRAVIFMHAVLEDQQRGRAIQMRYPQRRKGLRRGAPDAITLLLL